MSVDPKEQGRVAALNLAAIAAGKQASADQIALPSDDPMADYIFEPTEELKPGIYMSGDELFMTFNLIKRVRKTIGKGDAKREVVQPTKTTICVTNEGRIFDFDRETVTDQGFIWPEIFVQPPSDSRWHLPYLDRFRKGLSQQPDLWDLYNEVRSIYETYVEYPEPQHNDLMTLYVLLSYVFPAFDAVPYVHFNGTANAGKSQNLAILEALALNPIVSSSISPSAMFRTLASNIGLTAFDEAESWEGETKDGLLSMIKQGYKSGGNVIRNESSQNSWTPQKFKIYSPKVFASINQQDFVLQTRAFVITMRPAVRRIPSFPEHDDRWLDVRDRLYLWAMFHATKVRDHGKVLQQKHQDGGLVPDLNNRQWEISHCLITIADYVGGDALVQPLITWLLEYFKQSMANANASDRTATLLRCLPRVLANNAYEGDFYYPIKLIHEEVKSRLDEDQRDKYYSRSASKTLNTLGFKDRKQGRAGALVQIKEADVRAAIITHHTEVFDEDLGWFNDETNYQHPDVQTASTTIWNNTLGDTDGDTEAG